MAPIGDFPFNDFNQFPGNFTDPSLPPAPLQPGQDVYASSPAASSPTPGVAPSGTKRKSDSISTSPSDTQSFEEASRLAAEEDKRRRNTAASARFRVKKKQREQALERSAKEMSDKVAALEGRINQLETENKWLKNLITEKNDSKEDIAALWKKFNAENEQRKGTERKSGVGTKA
jgi:Basic region leucine zipper